jgi:predicted small metal-binding protein
MVYKFKCKDIGMQCGFETKAKTMEELMQKIVEHAQKEHGMKEIPPELQEKVKNAIKKSLF